MTWINGSMLHRKSRRRNGKRRPAPDRRRRRFEQLEERVLLSTGDPVKDDAIQRLKEAQLVDDDTILWSGQQVDFVADEWITRLTMDEDLSVQEQLAQATAFFEDAFPDATVRAHLGMTGAFSIEIPVFSKQQMVMLLQDHDEMRYLEPNGIVRAKQTFPNDPLFNQMWGLNNTGQTGGTADADIDAPEAWDLTTGNRNIVVGIIDTGIDLQHPDVQANLWVNPGEVAGDGIDNDGNGFIDDVNGWDFINNDAIPFDDNGHGTHVGGTVGAVGDNALGVTGVNWDVQLMALKMLDASGSGTIAAGVSAINYATMMRQSFGIDVRVTNNSWGGPGFFQTVLDAIIANNATGMLFVAAAGNATADNDAIFDTPSGYLVPNVIAVAATDDNDQIAGFSNFGATSVDLGAPGVDILSTVPTAGPISDPSGFLAVSGTSQASPHVAGAAALIWSIAPNATHIEVRDAIFNTVDPLPSLQGITVTGGRLNLFRAVELLAPEDGGQQVEDVPPVVVDVELRDLNVVVTFSEPVTNVSADTFIFQGAGPDGIFDTADDRNYVPLPPTPATRAELFAFARQPRGIAVGPDGNIYVSNAEADSVLRYDRTTGQFLSELIPPGVGGLDNPGDLVFGPNADLFVISSGTQSILRYNALTGAFLGQFVAPGAGGLDEPQGIAVGADGNLYVTSRLSDRVLRYDGQSGALLNVFVPSGSGGLDDPTDLIFGPDGNLYVASGANGMVLRYNGSTGAFLGVFASGGGLTAPRGMTFGPDGNLYVSSFDQNKVLRYNGVTGAFLDDFAGGGQIAGPDNLVFRSDGVLLLSSSLNDQVLQFDANVWTFTIDPSQSVPNGLYRLILKGDGATPYTFTKLAATTDPAISGVLDTAINNVGTVATLVNLAGGGQAIQLHDANGTTTLVDTNTSAIASITRIALNDTGLVAIRGARDSGASGVFLVQSDGTVTNVALESLLVSIDPAELALNNNSEVVFLERSGGQFRVRRGSPGNIQTVADSSGTLATMSSLALNDAGQVFFRATLDVGGESIVLADGTARTTLANTFGRFAAFGAVAANDAGTVVFTAITDTGVVELVQIEAGVESTITDSAVKRLAAKGVPQISDEGIIVFQADILSATGTPVADGVFTASLSVVSEVARNGTAMVPGEPIVSAFLLARLNTEEQLSLVTAQVGGSIGVFLGQPTQPIRDIDESGAANLALDGDPDGLDGPLLPDGEPGGDFLQIFALTDRRARIDLRLADGDRFVDAARLVGTVPVVGDWLGSGVDSMGIFNRDTGQWSVDLNNNRRLEGREEFVQFGQADDIPVPGDWDPSQPGDELGVFRPSTGRWFLDTNGNRRLDGTETSGIQFGAAGDIPLVGDFNPLSPGDEIAVYRPSSGQWIVDVNGNRTPDEPLVTYGAANSIPLVGDWDGVNPAANIGVYNPANAEFLLDVNGSLVVEAADARFVFGQVGDTPVVGDWAALGRDTIGVFRSGTGVWFLDDDGGFDLDPAEGPIAFGKGGDEPVVGRWTASNTLLGVFREPTLEWFLDLDGDRVLVPREGPLGLGPSSDTGLKGDQTTNQATPVFVGQVLDEFPSVTAGTPITVVVDLDADNTGVLGMADYAIPGVVTDNEGRFVFRIPDEAGKRLSEGVHRVQASFVDLAGQTTVRSRGVRVDLTPPEVLSVAVSAVDVTDTPTPAEAALSGRFNRIEVRIDDPPVLGVNLGLDPSTATLSSNYRLVRSVNGVFGDGDDADISVAITSIALSFDPLISTISTLALSVNPAALPDDLYRFTILGAKTVTDAAGNPIVGNEDLDGDNVAREGDFVTHFRLDTTPPRVLSISTGLRSFFEGPYSDPPDDTFGPVPLVLPPLDIGAMSGAIQGTDLVLRMEFFVPIEAPSTNPDTLLYDNRVFGFIDMDLDQNAETGAIPHQESLGPAVNAALGVELFVDLGSELFHPGLADIVDALSGLVVGTAPITFGERVLEVSVPLVLLAGIEEFNLGAIVGVDVNRNGTLEAGEGTDEILNARTVQSVLAPPPTLVDVELNVQPNVNVSADPFNQSEVTIAVNPTNSQNLIASAIDLSPVFVDPIWFSMNGGQTWTRVAIPNPPGASGLGDPTLAFDRQGNAYYGHLTSTNLLFGPDGIAVAKSTDGGQTWTSSNIPVPGIAFPDKEFLAVGPDPNNLAQDRIYLGFQDAVGNAQYITSSPNGVTWLAPVQVSDAGNPGINVQSAVDANGVVYVTWQGIDSSTPGFSNIWFDVSTDGGLTWGTDTIAYTTNVAPFNDPFLPNTCLAFMQYCVPAAPDRGIGAFLSIDVDRSGGPNDGNIYISILDQADLDGDPDANNAADHHDTDVFVIRSTDQGATWSAPLRINDDGATGASQFLPWLDVDQTTGDVAIVWYDARDDAANNEKVAVYMSASFDGGVTFEPNVRVSEGQSDQSLSNPLRAFGNNYLEYIGVAFQAGVAHVVWADNSGLLGTSPGNLDVFYAQVLTSAPAGALDITSADGRLDSALVTLTAGFSANTPIAAPSTTPVPVPDNRLFGFIVMDTNAFTGNVHPPTAVGGIDFFLDLGSEASHPGFVDLFDNRGKSPIIIGQAAITYSQTGIQLALPRQLLSGLVLSESTFRVVAMDSNLVERDRTDAAPLVLAAAPSVLDPLGDQFGPSVGAGLPLDLTASDVSIGSTTTIPGDIGLVWELRTGFADPRTGDRGVEGAAGSLIGERIYVSHGFRGSEATDPGLRDGMLLSIYDIPTNSWIHGGPLAPDASVRRSELAGATALGRHYAIGGRSVPNNDVEEFDPATRQWRQVAPMPTARGGLGAASFEDKIYAVGGRTGFSFGESIILGNNERYDPLTDTWTVLAGMPMPVSDNYATVAFEGKVYVFGGAQGPATVTNAVQIYDIASNTWSFGAPMPTPRAAAMAGVINNQIAVFGGFDPDRGNLNVTEIYNPATNTWSAGPRMPSPASEMAAGPTFDNNEIYAIGSGIFGATEGIVQVLRVDEEPDRTVGTQFLKVTLSLGRRVRAPSTTLSAGEVDDRLFGFVDFDVDRDPTTGLATGIQGVQNGTGMVGVELVADLGSEELHPGFIDIIDTATGQVIAMVPIAYGVAANATSQVQFSVALDELAAAGITVGGTVDYRVTVGPQSDPLGPPAVLDKTEASDEIANREVMQTRLTLAAPAPEQIVVTFTEDMVPPEDVGRVIRNALRVVRSGGDGVFAQDVFDGTNFVNPQADVIVAGTATFIATDQLAFTPDGPLVPDYYRVELVSQPSQAVINRFQQTLSLEAVARFNSKIVTTDLGDGSVSHSLLLADFDALLGDTQPPRTAEDFDPKTGPFSFLGSDLLGLMQQFQEFIDAEIDEIVAMSPEFSREEAYRRVDRSKFVPTNLLLQLDDEARVAVELFFSDQSHLADPADLLRLGMTNYVTDIDRTIVTGLLPIEQLYTLRQLDPGVVVIPQIEPKVHVGLADNLADQVMDSARVRATFGLDGRGVTVGVLSDSIGQVGGGLADSQASGDLPLGVSVLADLVGSGTDEGRAMLELIHDIAPGADLMFRTGARGIGDFAMGIQALAAAGANVIVDDLTYLFEPFFEDGIVARTIDQVVASGVTYFSAAGDAADQSYQAPSFWRQFNLPANPFDAGLYHDFRPGVQPDFLQRIVVEPGAGFTLDLQWDDRFGFAASDVDVLLLDAAGNLVGGAFSDNIASGTPVELVQFTNSGDAPVELDVVISLFAGPQPTFLKYVLFDAAGVEIQEFATNSSTIVGHSAAVGAEAVGAASVFDPANPEPTTSHGPTLIFFDAQGNRLSTPRVRQTPGITAPDGSNTSFFGTDVADDADLLPNFFGTSAAAANAAAVAALMLQADGTLDPDQVRQILHESAVDIVPPGLGFDNVTGFGMIDAFDAVTGAFANVAEPIVDLAGNPLDGEALGFRTAAGFNTPNDLNDDFQVFFNDGRRLPGMSGDGTAGGTFVSGFAIAAPGNVIFAQADNFDDPLITADDPDGTVRKPFPTLQRALGVADLDGDGVADPEPGSLAFKRANGSAGPIIVDALESTDQFTPYVAQSPPGSGVAATLELPAFSMLVLEPGTIVKLQNANIETSALGAVLQVSGAPGNPVTFTSFKDDSIGGDTNGDGDNSQPFGGDWGGLFFGRGSQDALTSVDFAEIRFGGGPVPLSFGPRTDPIFLEAARPNITNTNVSEARSAQAAISADFDSFKEDDLARGPLVRDVTLTNNSINSIWVRPQTLTGAAQQTDFRPVNSTFVFDDPIPIFLTSQMLFGERLTLSDPTQPNPRQQVPQRVNLEPGVVVKFKQLASIGVNATATLNVGDRVFLDSFFDPSVAQLPNTIGDARVLFTSALDDNATTGADFDGDGVVDRVFTAPIDTTNDGSATQPDASSAASRGLWGSVVVQPGTRMVIDEADFLFGGGPSLLPAGNISRHVLDLDGPLLSSTFPATFASITNNRFVANSGAGIAVDPDVLRAGDPLDPLGSGNPFIRGNILENNELNGLLIRSNPITDRPATFGGIFSMSVSNNTLWDDTDIVHIVRGPLTPQSFQEDFTERASLPGLPKPTSIVMTLQSALPGTVLANGEVIARPGESLVVKLENSGTDGTPAGADPAIGVGGVGPLGVWPQVTSGFQIGLDHGGTVCPGPDCPGITVQLVSGPGINTVIVRGNGAPIANSVFMHGYRSELRILGVPSNEAVDSERVPVVLTSLRDDATGVFVRGLFQGDTNSDGAATVPAPGDWGGIMIGGNAYSDYNLLDPADGSIIYNADIRFHSRIEFQGGGRLPINDLNGDLSITRNEDLLDFSLTPPDQRRSNIDNTTIALTVDSSMISNARDAGIWIHGNGFGLRAEPVPNVFSFFPIVQRTTDIAGVAVEAFIVNNIFTNNTIGLSLTGDVETGTCQDGNATGDSSLTQPPGNCSGFGDHRTRTIVVHNTFAGNPIAVGTAEPQNSVDVGPFFLNNIFAFSSIIAVQIPANTGFNSGQFNLYFGNTANGSTFTNPIFGDPLFVDAAAGNFNLRPGSAAVDASLSEFGPSIHGDLLTPVFVGSVRVPEGRDAFADPLELVRLPLSTFVPTSLMDPRFGLNLPGNPNFNASFPLGVPLFTPLNESDGERDFFGFQRLDAPERPNIGFGAKPFFDIGAIEFRDLGAPVVTNFLIPRDASLNPVALIAIFSEDMDPATVFSAGPMGTFIVQGSGGDGTFTDGNETFVSPSAAISFDPANNEALFDLTGQTLQDDRYRVILKGSGFPVMTDLDGVRLDGEFDAAAGFPSGDGFPGGDFIFEFAVDRVPPIILASSLDLAPPSDSNVLGDKITNDDTPAFIGTVSDTFPSSIQGLIVELDVDGDGFDDGSALTNLNGDFLVQSTTTMVDSEDLPASDPNKIIVDGQAFTRVRIRVTDQGGNQVVAALDVRIDTAPPVVFNASPIAQFPPTVVTSPLTAIDLVFNEDMDPATFAAAIQVLASGNDGEFVNNSIVITPSGAITFDPVTNTARFPVQNLLNDVYRVTLQSQLTLASVIDLAGNRLDGEFNPVRTSPGNPSGDGAAAGDFVYFFVLANPAAVQFDILVDLNSQAVAPDGRSPQPRVDPVTGALIGGPFSTIQAGIAAARPGQRVIVMDSAVDVDVDGDGDIDTRVASAYPEQVTMRSGINVFSDRPGLNVRTDVDGDGDIEVVSGDVDGDGLFGAVHTAIQSNAAATVVADSAFGTTLSGFSVLTQPPTAAQPTRVGISIIDSDIRVTGNIVVLNTTGIDVQLGLRPFFAAAGAVPRIENNVIWANLQRGLNVFSVSDPPRVPVPIFNNTVVFNSGPGVRLDGDKLQDPKGVVFGPDGNLYVVSSGGNTVRRYNGTTGALIGTFATGLSGATGLVFGSDGNLYVSNTGTDEILRFDGTTGALLNVFASNAALVDPQSLVFGGTDGNLYVASAANDRIVRFDANTGAFIDVFASSPQLDNPSGQVFGPDGNLYVSSAANDRVLRFDGTTGALMNVFAMGGGLDAPAGLRFGADGNLYVSSALTDRVLRFNGTTGVFIDVFASGGGLDEPNGLVFGPDLNLYVSSTRSDSVLQYDGISGAFLDTFAGGAGLLARAVNNIFTSNTLVDLELVAGDVSVEFNLFAPDRRGPAVAGDNVLPAGFPLSPTNKFAADPLFVFPLRPRPNDPLQRQQGNFRLRSGSPAIDAGTSSSAPTTDADGAGRVDIASVPNTGGGAQPFFDIGAYEFSGSSDAPPPAPAGAKDLAGVFRNGIWFLDLDGKGGAGERALTFGIPGDKPVSGDFDKNGTVDIGIFRNGIWFFDLNGQGGAAEKAFAFGVPGDVPIAGDFNADGRTDAGIFRNGIWFFDLNGTGGAAEKAFAFGMPGDIPLSGDINGDGTSDAVIYRNGIWFIDLDGKGGAAEMAFAFGMPGDKPVIGDWDGDGKDNVGIFRNGIWFFDLDGKGGAAEKAFAFGAGNDLPVAGAWPGAQANAKAAATTSFSSGAVVVSSAASTGSGLAQSTKQSDQSGATGTIATVAASADSPQQIQPAAAGPYDQTSGASDEPSDEQWDEALLDISDELTVDLAL